VLGIGLGTSCSRQTDSFPPQIVITSPASDTVTPRSNLVIKGYAWDDKGIFKLVLNGQTDLLAKGALAAQRGRKIVQFSIPADSLPGGQVSYSLRAVDGGRRSATREIRVTVDNVAPKLQIVNVDSQADTIAVSGVATDNQRVARVAVNGEPLNVSPGGRVEFYTVVPRTRQRTINFTVKDTVGNTITQSIPVPAPPVVIPVAATTDASTTTPTTTRRRSRLRRTQTTVVPPAPAVPQPPTPIGAPR
jgi:hypothetical protein